MRAWTILTCEYPPACGGVADYSALVAGALVAAGDRVTVCCPPQADRPTRQSGVEVIALDDVYGPRARRQLDKRLDGERSTVLVQYVPTAFGLGGANVPFCRWLLSRSRRHGDDVRVMFHEPYFEFAWTPVHQSPLSLAQRLMARTLLRASRQTYLSTDAWRAYLSPMLTDCEPFVTLPIPSAIPRCARPAEAGEQRRRATRRQSDRLVGHFGTYGAHVAPMLQSALTALLAGDPSLSVICTGAGSDLFARSMVDSDPALEGRVQGTGRVPADEAAAVLAACDLLVQPYIDGVTTRRTSVMAGLINARPVLTTTGHLTEAVWAETQAVAMVAAGDIPALVASAQALLAGGAARAALAARGENTYRARFSIERTIGALRGAVESVPA
jgi:hypothetical protein